MRALWRTAGRSKGGFILLLAARAKSSKSCKLFPPTAGFIRVRGGRNLVDFFRYRWLRAMDWFFKLRRSIMGELLECLKNYSPVEKKNN